MASAAKLEELTLVPRAPTVKGEVTSDLYTCATAHALSPPN